MCDACKNNDLTDLTDRVTQTFTYDRNWVRETATQLRATAPREVLDTPNHSDLTKLWATLAVQMEATKEPTTIAMVAAAAVIELAFGQPVATAPSGSVGQYL